MGLRSKLKETLGGLLGGTQDTERRPQPYRSPVAPIIDSARAQERAQAEERARVEAERAAAARAERFTPAASPAPAEAPAEAPKDADAEEKQRKFMARARKGLLTKVQEAGGAMPLGELHDHSEKRYFIAHRAFSNLMEEMVAEGLLDYESGTGIARLTDAGRSVMSGA